jgi:hypothetical protein
MCVSIQYILQAPSDIQNIQSRHVKKSPKKSHKTSKKNYQNGENVRERKKIGKVKIL